MPKTARKAGPKRIDPDSFVPVVWRIKQAAIGENTEYLVCKRRIYDGAPVAGFCKAEDKTAERFTHPMAIQVAPRHEPMTRLILFAGTWAFDSPEMHGISTRCAKVALAQVYHGITAKVDLVTMEAEFEPKFHDLLWHKKGVRLRNMATALRWTRWEKEGVPMEQRAAELQRVLNYQPQYCTATQIKRFAAEQGL